jgi:hypothetical protein
MGNKSWAHSSAGQSRRLITGRSQVRILVGPLLSLFGVFLLTGAREETSFPRMYVAGKARCPGVQRLYEISREPSHRSGTIECVRTQPGAFFFLCGYGILRAIRSALLIDPLHYLSAKREFFVLGASQGRRST